MTLSVSPNAYPDCFAFFEKCIDDPIGARKPFPSRSDAFDFRNRANYYRILVRRQNEKLYPPDDKRHGTSDYDEVRMSLKPAVEEGWWWVYGKKMTMMADDIEGLSEVEPAEPAADGEIDDNQAAE